MEKIYKLKFHCNSVPSWMEKLKPCDLYLCFVFTAHTSINNTISRLPGWKCQRRIKTFRWHSSTSKNVHIFYLKCSEKCSKQKVSLLSIIGWSQSAVDGRCICCVGGVDGIFICGAITWEPATSQESHLPTLVANAVNHSWKSEQT